jgi:colanic acid/amylovoran biosynthesis glycosyltransferase
MKELLKKQIIQLKLENNVIMSGFFKYGSKQHISAYQKADIFIHPSVTLSDYDKEGIPGTIVEAMASGLPVLSTHHAGIPSIIVNEKEGLLVDEKNVRQLAEALYRLIANPELREKLGRNAQRKAVAELDLYKGTECLEKIYDEVLDEYEKRK